MHFGLANLSAPPLAAKFIIPIINNNNKQINRQTDKGCLILGTEVVGNAAKFIISNNHNSLSMEPSTRTDRRTDKGCLILGLKTEVVGNQRYIILPTSKMGGSFIRGFLPT